MMLPKEQGFIANLPLIPGALPQGQFIDKKRVDK